MNYYITENGNQHGPFSEEEVRAQFASGSLSSSTLVWTEGMPDWKPISEVFARVSPPPIPASQTSGQSPPLASIERRRYPKWPWIGFAVCCFLWLIFVSLASNIKQEALPLINEQARMNSGEYLVGVGVESFFRGALGDPFGKAGEEYSKATAIGDRLQQLSANYESTKSTASFFGWLAVLFGGLWIWRHVKHKKTIT